MRLRQAKTKPVVDDLDTWLGGQFTGIFGKTPLAQAIRYAITRIRRLKPYLDHERTAQRVWLYDGDAERCLCRRKEAEMKYENTMMTASCPICYSEKGMLLWSVDTESATRHFVSPNEDPDRFEKLNAQLYSLWQGSHCNVVVCCNCDFTYSYPYVSGDKIFYDLAYVRHGYPSWRWDFEVALNLIKKDQLHEPSILEIGAGDGAFIKSLLRDVTPISNITAIEYSIYGKKQIENMQVSCLSEDIRIISHDRFNKCFDIVCMFQVLEHMDDLDGLMRRLKGVLKEGGSIIISVPSENWIKFNELNGALLDMPPNHIGRWTKKAFERLASNHGFEVCSHAYEPFSLVSSFKQLVRYRFLKRSQSDHSVENFVRYKIRNPIVKMIATLGIISLDSLINLPKVGLFISQRKLLGLIQIVVLRLP